MVREELGLDGVGVAFKGRFEGCCVMTGRGAKQKLVLLIVMIIIK